MPGSKVSQELGTWIANELGIDPTTVLGLTIRLDASNAALVDVRMLVEDDGGRLVEELKRYELREPDA